MDIRIRRRLQAILASAGMFLACGVLFFAPWVRLGCDPQTILVKPITVGEAHRDQALASPQQIATASGWDLAWGQMSVNPDLQRFREVPTQQIAEKSLQPRYWLLAGLAVPVAGVLICLLATTSNARIDSTGFAMKVLAIFGLIVLATVVTEDYVFQTQPLAAEIILTQAEVCWLTPGQQEFTEPLRQASRRWSLAAQARPTPWLLIGFPLYVGIGLVGFYCTRLEAGLCHAHRCRSSAMPLRADAAQPPPPPAGPVARPGQTRTVQQHLGGESLYDPDGTGELPSSRQSWSAGPDEPAETEGR